MKELESVEYDSWKSEHAWMEERYIDEIKRQYDDTQSKGSLVVSDADYIALSYSVGTTDGRLDVIPFERKGSTVSHTAPAYLMVTPQTVPPPKNTCGLSSGTRWSRATRYLPSECRRPVRELCYRRYFADDHTCLYVPVRVFHHAFVLHEPGARGRHSACHRRFPEESAVPIPPDRDGYADAVDVFIGSFVASLLMMYPSPVRHSSISCCTLVAGGWTAGCHPTACILSGLLPAMLLSCAARPVRFYPNMTYNGEILHPEATSKSALPHIFCRILYLTLDGGAEFVVMIGVQSCLCPRWSYRCSILQQSVLASPSAQDAFRNGSVRRAGVSIGSVTYLYPVGGATCASGRRRAEPTGRGHRSSAVVPDFVPNGSVGADDRRTCRNRAEKSARCDLDFRPVACYNTRIHQ